MPEFSIYQSLPPARVWTARHWIAAIGAGTLGAGIFGALTGPMLVVGPLSPED
jgi:hypothetical protein